MFKAVLFLVFLLSYSGIFAQQIAARVGDYQITVEQLNSRIRDISKEEEYASLGFSERRKIALDELINDKLLYHYALSNNVSVSQDEVEYFFIDLYGDLPRFLTDGMFDYEKFKIQKNTPEIRQVLGELRQDMIVHKARTILTNNFKYSDNILYEKFLQENTEIDLSYSLVKKKDAAVPFVIDPDELYRFYYQNSELFPEPIEVEIDFFIVQFDDLADKTELDEAEFYEMFEEIYLNYKKSTVIDSTETAENLLLVPRQRNVMNPLSESYYRQVKNSYEGGSVIDSLSFKDKLYEILLEDKITELTRKEAEKNTERIIRGYRSTYPVISHNSFLPPYDKHCSIALFERNKLNDIILSYPVGNFSEPVKIDGGFLVFRVGSFIQKNEELNVPLAQMIWKEYLKKRLKSDFSGNLTEYYNENLTELITPAAHITRFLIPKHKVISNLSMSDRDLSQFFSRHRGLFAKDVEALSFFELQELIRKKYIELELNKLTRWTEDNLHRLGVDLQSYGKRVYNNSIEVENFILFLEKYPSNDRVNRLIATALDKKEKTGRIEEEDVIAYYRINSYFPAYIPDLDDIKEFLVVDSDFKFVEAEEDYLQYYTDNKSIFTSPDSLRLTGVFVPKETTGFISVSEKELLDLYQDKKNLLYSPQTVKIEYIAVKDEDIQKKQMINNINSMIKSGIGFNLLRYCFNNIEPYPQNREIDLTSLPVFLRKVVGNLSTGEISDPLYYENSWYIIRKIESNEPHPLTFYEARELLKSEIMQEKMDELAHQQAKQLFIDINSIKDIYDYADSTLIFRTDVTAINDEFGVLGDIGTYIPQLLTMRRNEKLNTLLITSQGYGVVFLAEKKAKKELDFEDVFPKVKEMYHQEQDTKNAEMFIRNIREYIINGKDPNEVLVFWGGWHRLNKISYNDTIPGIRYSNLIIENAIKRSVGEISHIFKNGEDAFTFYQLDRKREANVTDFRRQKDSYRIKVMNRDFNRWLQEYKARVKIELF